MFYLFSNGGRSNLKLFLSVEDPDPFHFRLPDPDPLQSMTWIRIDPMRIRIHKIWWMRSEQDLRIWILKPFQNETDPQHCFSSFCLQFGGSVTILSTLICFNVIYYESILHNAVPATRQLYLNNIRHRVDPDSSHHPLPEPVYSGPEQVSRYSTGLILNSITQGCNNPVFSLSKTNLILEMYGQFS